MPSLSYGPPRDASSAADPLGPLGARLRRADPARYFAVLFAAPAKRPALLALLGFAAELARAPTVASEPAIALMRLMWWREVVEGVPRAHEVASPLAAALAAGLLGRADLLGAIAAWERAVEHGIPDLGAWRDWAEGSAGAIAVAGARLLGAGAPEALRPLGAIEGAARLLAASPALAVRGVCLLPEDALAAHRLVVADLAGARPEARALRATLARDALSWLPVARPQPGRAALPAVLAAGPARRALARWAAGREAGEFRLGARLAMFAAWTSGRS